MPEYQLEIKQVVDYPRCRIDGISYTVYPGEWIREKCRYQMRIKFLM